MHLRDPTLQNCRFADLGPCGVFLTEQDRAIGAPMNRGQRFLCSRGDGAIASTTWAAAAADPSRLQGGR